MSSAPDLAVIAYDGSPAARQAITDAGRLLTPRQVIVITVWEEALAFVPPVTGLGAIGPAPLDLELINDLERSAQHHAERIAGEGAALARSAGLDARGITRPDVGGVAETILRAGADVAASVIVIGSGGVDGLLKRLEGSTANRVLAHASCPVFVVHAADEPSG